MILKTLSDGIIAGKQGLIETPAEEPEVKEEVKEEVVTEE